MADSRDITGKNRKFTGTEGITVPTGTTAQRIGSVAGEIRFNSTINLMEYYDGTQWKSIDSPPSVSSVSPTSYDGNAGQAFTVTGSNFGNGSTVSFVGQDGAILAASTTFNSVTSLTGTISVDATVAQGPLGVKVENVSGLSNTLADAITTGTAPSMVTPAGSLGTFGYNSSVSVFVVGQDPDSTGAVTFAVSSGSLPSGLSLNSSTGEISGTAPNADATFNFSIKCTDNAGNDSSTVAYSMVIFNSITIDALIVGGGGAGAQYGGGGGGGEVLSVACRSLSTGTAYTATIGAGATTQAPMPNPVGAKGAATTFIQETALGGGGGRNADYNSTNPSPVANGGGGGSRSNSYGGSQGSSVGSGVTRYGGYSGGNGSCPSAYPAGGGGGAGGNGGSQPSSGGNPGNGGTGVSLNYQGTSYYWGGGGGGSAHQYNRGGNGGAGGGGGGWGQPAGSTGGSGLNAGGSPQGTPNSRGGAGGANTGGGGGGSAGADGSSNDTPGLGGSGIVVARYTGSSQLATGGTITTYTSGPTTYQVHTFTSSGDFQT